MLRLAGLRSMLGRARSFATEAVVSEAVVRTALEEALKPSVLKVDDLSGGCGTMFAVEVVSERFRGLAQLKQHRLVNEILKNQIKGMHGLQLRTSAPK